MGKRKIEFRLGIDYYTPAEKLESLVRRLKSCCKAMMEYTRNNFVTFDKLPKAGWKSFTFTKTTVWAEYLEVKQDINLKVLKILEEEDVQLAYPAQTIYVEFVKRQNRLVKKKKIKGCNIVAAFSFI